MQILNEVIKNKFIVVPVCIWFCIQIFKTLTDLIINKKLDMKRLLGAGGMPSSHSAVVTSLAVMIGKEYGFNSGIFAIALVFSFVVMYDAAGVRRAAGKQARILNKILDTPGLTIGEVQEKLVEVLGHTPIQVFVGAAIGVFIGAII